MNGLDGVLDELEKMERIKNSLGGKIAVIIVYIGMLGVVFSIAGTTIFQHREFMFAIGFLSIITGIALFYLLIAYLLLTRKKNKITIAART